MSKYFYIRTCFFLAVLFTSQIVFAFNFDSVLKDVTKTVSQTVDSASKLSGTLDELTGNKDKKDLQNQLEQERRKRKALERKLSRKKFGQNNQDRISRKTKRASNRKSKKGPANHDSLGEFADLAGDVDVTSKDSRRPAPGQYSQDRDPAGQFADLKK